jgi:4-hydroxy-tetrahydrodipicolinate reductase
MIKIGLFGYGGRMGQLIAEEIAASEACILASGGVRTPPPEEKKTEGLLITPHTDDVVAISDVVIDFSTADAVTAHAESAAVHKKPYMTGVTGLDAATQEALKLVAAKIPLLYAANTSVSLTAMKQATELAARLLAPFDYEIAITDEHHRAKKDAPSGTAKALGEAVTRGNDSKKVPTYSSIREGNIIGEHEVMFVGAGEIIRLHHSVTDRRVFARGALEAALWLHGKKPGFYGMEDVLGISAR